MKQNKGYPHREKKKPKKNFPEDKRPHNHIHHSWWRSNEEPPTKKGEEKFYVPNIKIGGARYRWNDQYKMDVWTSEETHDLIDMWARISWGRGSEFHKAMSKQARYFQKLWIKQKGRCALTNTELHGAPGCGGNGIGIDIINPAFGIRKGNIRLVSAPLAYTRFKTMKACHCIFKPVDPDNYEQFPIFWAVLKHLQWHLKKNDPFLGAPIEVIFPAPRFRDNVGVGYRAGPWVRFRWQCYYPKDSTLAAWDELEYQSTEFATIYFVDDKIHIDYGHKYKHSRSEFDHTILLYDPTIDIIEEMVKCIKLGFGSIDQWLNEKGHQKRSSSRR